MRAAILALLAALAAAAPAGADGFRLLMVEQPSCPWCRLFDRETAAAYAASPEGRAAPLERVQLGGPLPEGVRLASPAVGTPTFVLLGPDGAERARLVGYPGAEFFWAQLGGMFDRAGVALPAPSD